MGQKTHPMLTRPTQNPLFAVAFFTVLAPVGSLRGDAPDTREFSQIVGEHGPVVARLDNQARNAVILQDGTSRYVHLKNLFSEIYNDCVPAGEVPDAAA